MDNYDRAGKSRYGCSKMRSSLLNLSVHFEHVYKELNSVTIMVYLDFPCWKSLTKAFTAVTSTERRQTLA